jgi:ADP-heptose:LPS heptosyltransferase
LPPDERGQGFARRGAECGLDGLFSACRIGVAARHQLGSAGALLRQHRPQSIWILDRTIRPALAAALAGIPERIGLGLGPQSAFITNHGIGQDHFHDHPIDWLRALMAAMKVPLVSTEPDLQAPTPVLSLIGEKFAQFARPWIAVGIGASHPDKDWPDATWCEFLAGLRTPGTVFLVGGPANYARAEKFVVASGSRQIVNACDLSLIEAAALLRLADLFVGPSSGPLNLAAAGGTQVLRPVRLDAGFDLFEIHPRHRAGRRSCLWRHGADHTGASTRAKQSIGIDRPRA